MKSAVPIAAFAFVGGVADWMNDWAAPVPIRPLGVPVMTAGGIVTRGLAFAMIALLLRWCWSSLARFSGWTADEQELFLRITLRAYALPLVLLLGAFGVQFPNRLNLLLVFAFFAVHAAGFVYVEEKRLAAPADARLLILFLVSGFSALIYQVSWQRILLTQLGVNIESVTCIVSVFMIGLGAGALAGGAVASRMPDHLRLLFLCAETVIGLFGLGSVSLLRFVGSLTVGASLPIMVLTVYALLFVPTLLMGATLPILVTYLYQTRKSMVGSVSILYFVNTIGSAAACFVTVEVLFVFLGLRGSVMVASLGNFLVAGLLFYGMRANRRGSRQANTLA